jgi:hypothetical protein
MNNVDIPARIFPVTCLWRTSMKYLKIAGALFCTYVLLVVLLAIVVVNVQPEMPGGIVLTTTNAQGEKLDRVLAAVKMDDKLYVSANHWARAWYNRALRDPNVGVIINGASRPYLAVPVTGNERDQIHAAYDFPLLLRFITGFAPQSYLRLDPV